MKKILCMLLVLCMFCTLLAGCGEREPQAQEAQETQETQEGQEGQEAQSDEPLMNTFGENKLTDAAEQAAEQTGEQAAAQVEEQAAGDASEGERDFGRVLTGEKVLENVSFVMIYNPLVYEERNKEQIENSTRSSGDLSGQIVTGLPRAMELDPSASLQGSSLSQLELETIFSYNPAGLQHITIGRLDPVYQKGSTHVFFRADAAIKSRFQEKFTCVYVGEHCYIWSVDGAIGEEDAEKVGKEFDENVYMKDIEYFGTPRFTERGGKVNLLFYPFTDAPNCAGFFYSGDKFSSEECSEEWAESKRFNLDHAIININSDFLKREAYITFLYSTMAHELQHQICSSETCYFTGCPEIQTWLNEAMSAYAEEICYPGVKDGLRFNQYMYASERYMKGQSIYNFGLDNKDIGCYGVVFLFGKYLTARAGEDVFSKLHTYWRSCERTDVTVAEALCASVPQAFFDEIDGKYSYPAGISEQFRSREEEWMSKLVLDFYLEFLHPENAGLTDLAHNAQVQMLYCKEAPVEIEGGGRVIVAVENGSFTIPADAGEGLIYIGLDENFNVVTAFRAN